MSPRLRVVLVVLAAALVGAGATLAVVVATDGDDAGGEAGRPQEGAPPLLLDFGVRSDAEAVALRRGQRLYEQQRRPAAGRVFRRYASVESEIGAVLSDWPRDGVSRLEEIAAAHPRRAVAHLHLGLGRFWIGRTRSALEAWRTAERVEPDSLSAVRAGDLVHPEFAPGLPTFVPSFRPPAALDGLDRPAQLALLERRAKRPDVRAKLLYGLALQRLGRPLSARRLYAAAAALGPRDAEAQVAAAVGVFDKRRPELAFGRLGPLTRRFPQAATVRLHLGLLLLWSGRVDEARRQLTRAVRLEPGSPLAREARRVLDGVEKARSGGE